MIQNAPERVFQVTGMTCDHCQRAVDSAIRQLHGVQNVRVNLNTGEAKVVGNASDQEVSAAVEEAGYEATRITDNESDNERLEV